MRHQKIDGQAGGMPAQPFGKPPKKTSMSESELKKDGNVPFLMAPVTEDMPKIELPGRFLNQLAGKAGRLPGRREEARVTRSFIKLTGDPGPESAFGSVASSEF